MLHELTQAESQHAVQLFSAPHLALVARAVACGNGPGRFWVDDLAVPRASLLWDHGRHLYLAGDASAVRPIDLRDILARTVLPAVPTGAFSRYEAHADGEALAQLWTQVLPGGTRRSRVFLARKTSDAPHGSALPDPAFQLRLIDAALLRDDGLEYVQDVRTEVAGMWGSIEAFLQKGFGYCIVDGRRIVCWCTAEYVSPGWCGIGIETVEAYQGRGLATATASAFVAHCALGGIQPHWDCWATNAPSVRVAMNVGFERVEEYEVYCGRLADARHQATPGEAQ